MNPSSSFLLTTHIVLKIIITTTVQVYASVERHGHKGITKTSTLAGESRLGKIYLKLQKDVTGAWILIVFKEFLKGACHYPL